MLDWKHCDPREVIMISPADIVTTPTPDGHFSIIVAGACAATVAAPFLSFHRGLRSDGGLSGFRWGAGIERSLLDREARADTVGVDAVPA